MNGFIRTIVIACFALSASLVSATASAADVAWLWADQPAATAAYSPNAGYSFNSKGGTNTVQRFGAGAYKVTIGSFNGSQNNAVAAHVVAYGGSHRCNITGWAGSNTQQVVNVLCYNGAQAADGRFVVLYYDESTQSQLAGAHQYGVRTWNSMGGTNTRRKIATGSYEVTLGKQGSYTGMGAVLVTAMSTTSQYCKVASWSKSNTTPTKDLIVKVLCFDSAGRAADAPFVISSFANPYFGATASRRHGAFALATRPTSTTSYATDPNYTMNSTTTGGVSALKSGTGSYTVSLAGLAASNKTAAVTIAYGTDNVQCAPVNWSGSTTATSLKVACRNGAGALADSKFGVLYLTNKAIPGSAYQAPVLH